MKRVLGESVPQTPTLPVTQLGAVSKAKRAKAHKRSEQMAAEDGPGEGVDEFPGATKGATDSGDVNKGDGAEDSFDSNDWEGDDSESEAESEESA